MKLGILFASALLVACGSSPKPDAAVAAFVREARKPVSAASVATGAEMRVRLDQDLGPGLSPAGKLFTARLSAALLDQRGVVLVPAGSLVHGRVIHVDDTERRIELAFERLETRDGIFRLRVAVIAATPYAHTVAPSGVRTSDNVVLQAVVPTALGGGPIPPESEAEEGAPRGDPIVPFDGELRLRLLGPLVRSSD